MAGDESAPGDRPCGVVWSDATTAAVTLMAGPGDIPAGRFGMMADPVGAACAVIALAAP